MVKARCLASRPGVDVSLRLISLVVGSMSLLELPRCNPVGPWVSLLSRAGKLPAQRQGGNEDTPRARWRTPGGPRRGPQRPARHRGRRRGLAGLPLPGAGERHGIANGHMLAAIVDQVLLVPVAKAEGVDLGAAQRTGRRGAGGKFDQGHGRRKLAVACLAAVTLTQRESKAPRGPRVSLRCPDADRRPRASARTFRPACRTLVGNSCLCSGLNS